LNFNDNPDFQAGREAGRTISKIIGGAEIVGGLISLATSIIEVSFTEGAAAACTAGTFGGCAPIAIPLTVVTVTVAVAQAVAGAALAAHGSLMLAVNALNPVGGGKIAPSQSPKWNELENYRDGLKRSGSGKQTRYYQWDYTHGHIEVYDKSGRHLGEMDPITGELIPGTADPSKNIRDLLK
jgi:hypothetical protein